MILAVGEGDAAAELVHDSLQTREPHLRNACRVVEPVGPVVPTIDVVEGGANIWQRTNVLAAELYEREPAELADAYIRDDINVVHTRYLLTCDDVDGECFEVEEPVREVRCVEYELAHHRTGRATASDFPTTGTDCGGSDGDLSLIHI